MVALVNAMLDSKIATPVLVLSNQPNCAGLQKAAALGVPTATVDHTEFKGDRHGFEAQMNLALEAAEAEFLCLAGFMRITTPEFVEHWRGRILNIHPSLLPKYPGLNVHEQVLAAGDKESGCTVHEVTSELDVGPILGQWRVPVLEADTAQTLAARVLVREHQLYPEVVLRFVTGNRTPILRP